MFLSDEEINPADVKSTQAVDIFAFVGAEDIPFFYFETPYYLAPAPGDEKIYALLRETLNRTRKIGVAYVVIQARKQLAALTPCGPVLMLNLLRCGGEQRTSELLSLAGEGPQAADMTEQELATAAEIVESMTQKWDVSLYRDNFELGDEPDDVPIGSADLMDLLGDSDYLEESRRLHGHCSMRQPQRNSRPRLRSRRTLH